MCVWFHRLLHQFLRCVSNCPSNTHSDVWVCGSYTYSEPTDDLPHSLPPKIDCQESWFGEKMVTCLFTFNLCNWDWTQTLSLFSLHLLVNCSCSLSNCHVLWGVLDFLLPLICIFVYRGCCNPVSMFIANIFPQYHLPFISLIMVYFNYVFKGSFVFFFPQGLISLAFLLKHVGIFLDKTFTSEKSILKNILFKNLHFHPWGFSLRVQLF